MLSWAESNDGLAADAIAHAQDALLRTPVGRDRQPVLWALGLGHWVDGDPAVALPYAREAIAGTAAFGQRYGVLVACLAELGELDEAWRLLAHPEALAPGYVKSRLEGKTWFNRQDLAARYTSALRKGRGPGIDNRRGTPRSHESEGRPIGGAAISGSRPASTGTRSCKYVCIWKKQKDGSCKAIHDAGNSDSM
jgi:hypothetical protein